VPIGDPTEHGRRRRRVPLGASACTVRAGR
jgi:hypothetical protein